MLILRPLALLSFSSFLDSSLRLILRLILLSLPSFHFLALLPEDQLLEPQQRDLLLLQQAHHIEQGPQEPSDHSLILLAQCGLLDFLDQGLDFRRIDFGYLVVRFSHSSHTSVLRSTIASRFLACGAQSCHLHFARTISQIHALLPKLHLVTDTHCPLLCGPSRRSAGAARCVQSNPTNRCRHAAAPRPRRCACQFHTTTRPTSGRARCRKRPAPVRLARNSIPAAAFVAVCASANARAPACLCWRDVKKVCTAVVAR